MSNDLCNKGQCNAMVYLWTKRFAMCATRTRTRGRGAARRKRVGYMGSLGFRGAERRKRVGYMGDDNLSDVGYDSWGSEVKD
jgi:hypothetical protein